MEIYNYSELDKSILGDPINPDKGSRGDVYRYGDIAIKKYKKVSYDCDNIQLDMFENLREIQLPAFVELIDCTTEMVENEREPYDIYGRPNKREVVSAYSARFYETSNESMIDKPLDYTLSSLYELRKLLKELSDREISIVDSHFENCIVTENGLVIIDPDFYRIRKNPYKINEKRIRDYLYDLWFEEYKDESLTHFETDYVIDDVLKGSIDDVIERVRTLEGRTPREVLDRKLQR
jgi:hypothetical protein